MKSSFALAPAPWQQWMGAFVVEVSVRPCELPLAFDAFSQTYQALPRQEGDLLWIRLWFESCTARAEPCQLAVWRVKMCSLKGSDVFFVRPLCARSKEEEEVQCKRGNFCLFHNKIDTCFLYRHAKSHMVLTGRGETSMSRGVLLLQKLSEVLADVLAAGPLAHSVTVQGVSPSTFFM